MALIIEDGVKFSSLATASSVTAFDYFIGVRDNGGDNFSNYKFSVTSLLAYISSISSIKHTIATIEISTTTNIDDSLTVAAIATLEIQKVYLNDQVYIRDEGFTQVGSKLILRSSFWQNTQKTIFEI